MAAGGGGSVSGEEWRCWREGGRREREEAARVRRTRRASAEFVIGSRRSLSFFSLLEGGALRTGVSSVEGGAAETVMSECEDRTFGRER